MLVRSQSGEAIAAVVHIYLSEMMGESDYYIFGTCEGHGMFSGSKITLGIYKSKKAAIAELDNIESFFGENPNGVYRMRKIK